MGKMQQVRRRSWGRCADGKRHAGCPDAHAYLPSVAHRMRPNVSVPMSSWSSSPASPPLTSTCPSAAHTCKTLLRKTTAPHTVTTTHLPHAVQHLPLCGEGVGGVAVGCVQHQRAPRAHQRLQGRGVWSFIHTISVPGSTWSMAGYFHQHPPSALDPRPPSTARTRPCPSCSVPPGTGTSAAPVISHGTSLGLPLTVTHLQRRQLPHLLRQAAVPGVQHGRAAAAGRGVRHHHGGAGAVVGVHQRQRVAWGEDRGMRSGDGRALQWRQVGVTLDDCNPVIALPWDPGGLGEKWIQGAVERAIACDTN